MVEFRRNVLMRHWLIALAVLSYSATAYADVSGSYLGRASGLTWIRLVEAPDGSVSGEVDVTTLLSTGELRRFHSPLSGSVNGNRITLRLQVFQPGVWFDSADAAGELIGDTWTLMGQTRAGLAGFVLRRSTEADYQRMLSGFERWSEARIAEQRKKDIDTH